MYQLSDLFRQEIRAAGGPEKWAQQYGYSPAVISSYFLGTRAAMEVTLRLIYLEHIFYWNQAGVKKWQELAA